MSDIAKLYGAMEPMNEEPKQIKTELTHSNKRVRKMAVPHKKAILDELYHNNVKKNQEEDSANVNSSSSRENEADESEDFEDAHDDDYEDDAKNNGESSRNSGGEASSPKSRDASNTQNSKKTTQPNGKRSAKEQPALEQGWSTAKQTAYQSKCENLYHFRFNSPGEPKNMGPWSEEEKQLFLKRLDEVGTESGWGFFSRGIPGRVGYQCNNFYRQLVANGDIQLIETAVSIMEYIPKEEDKATHLPLYVGQKVQIKSRTVDSSPGHWMVQTVKTDAVRDPESGEFKLQSGVVPLDALKVIKPAMRREKGAAKKTQREVKRGVRRGRSGSTKENVNNNNNNNNIANNGPTNCKDGKWIGKMLKRQSSMRLDDSRIDDDDDVVDDDDDEDYEEDDDDDDYTSRPNDGTRRGSRRGRGRDRKTAYYSAIQLSNGERFCVGDCAYFDIADDSEEEEDAMDEKPARNGKSKPYSIGRITSLFQEGGEKMVECIWYYRPEETKNGRSKKHHRHEVFLSDARDSNPVNAIVANSRVEVLSPLEFENRSQKGESLSNVYFCNKYYSMDDHTVFTIDLEENIFLQTADLEPSSFVASKIQQEKCKVKLLLTELMLSRAKVQEEQDSKKRKKEEEEESRPSLTEKRRKVSPKVETPVPLRQSFDHLEDNQETSQKLSDLLAIATEEDGEFLNKLKHESNTRIGPLLKTVDAQITT